MARTAFALAVSTCFGLQVAKLTLHRMHIGLENGQTNLGIGVVTNGDCDTAI